MKSELIVSVMKLPSPGCFFEISDLLENVSSRKKNQLEKYINREDIYRSLFADILVRTMICRFSGLQNVDLRIEYDRFGKPYLDNVSNLCFNVTHSGEWVAIVLGEGLVGIDIEQIQKIDYVRIARRFFSVDEVRDLEELPVEEQLEYFFDLWTMKESFVKALGFGLNFEMSKFTVFRVGEEFFVYSPYVVSNFRLKQYFVDPNYKLAVCIADNLLYPLEVERIECDRLIEEFRKFCLKKSIC